MKMPVEKIPLPPDVARLLDVVSPRITDAAAQRMNAAVESGHRDPADVAAEFLAGKTG